MQQQQNQNGRMTFPARGANPRIRIRSTMQRILERRAQQGAMPAATTAQSDTQLSVHSSAKDTRSKQSITRLVPAAERAPRKKTKMGAFAAALAAADGTGHNAVHRNVEGRKTPVSLRAGSSQQQQLNRMYTKHSGKSREKTQPVSNLSGGAGTASQQNKPKRMFAAVEPDNYQSLWGEDGGGVPCGANHNKSGVNHPCTMGGPPIPLRHFPAAMRGESPPLKQCQHVETGQAGRGPSQPAPILPVPMPAPAKDSGSIAAASRTHDPVHESSPESESVAERMRAAFPKRRVIHVKEAEAGCGAVPQPGTRAEALLRQAPGQLGQLVRIFAGPSSSSTSPADHDIDTVDVQDEVQASESKADPQTSSVPVTTSGRVHGSAQSFALSLLQRTSGLCRQPAHNFGATDSTDAVVAEGESKHEVDCVHEAKELSSVHAVPAQAGHASDSGSNSTFGEVTDESESDDDFDSTLRAESYADFCEMLGVQSPLGGRIPTHTTSSFSVGTNLLDGPSEHDQSAGSTPQPREILEQIARNLRHTVSSGIAVTDASAQQLMQPLMDAFFSSQHHQQPQQRQHLRRVLPQQLGRTAVPVELSGETSNDDDLEDIEITDANTVVVSSRMFSSSLFDADRNDAEGETQERDAGGSPVPGGRSGHLNAATRAPRVASANTTQKEVKKKLAVDNWVDLVDFGTDSDDQSEAAPTSSDDLHVSADRLSASSPPSDEATKNNSKEAADEGQSQGASRLLEVCLSPQTHQVSTAGNQRERLDSNDFVVLSEGEDSSVLSQPPLHQKESSSDCLECTLQPTRAEAGCDRDHVLQNTSGSVLHDVSQDNSSAECPGIVSTTSPDSWEDTGLVSELTPAVDGASANAGADADDEESGDDDDDVEDDWNIVTSPAKEAGSGNTTEEKCSEDDYRSFVANNMQADRQKAVAAADLARSNLVQPFTIDEEFDYDNCECVPRFGGLQSEGGV